MPVRCKFWHKPVCCRTSPWHFIWGTTGKMRGCPSPAPTTKAWPLMAGWWRRSGSPTCSSSTPSVPSSTTPPQTTSCCGSSQMGRYFIASGKAAFGQCKLLVEWERKHFNWFLYCVFAWLHTKKNIKKNESADYPLHLSPCASSLSACRRKPIPMPMLLVPQHPFALRAWLASALAVGKLWPDAAVPWGMKAPWRAHFW